MNETQTTGTDAPLEDTAAPQTSEADVQINNEAPEAAPAQEAEVNVTDTAEEKLYAGKYKTVDDLEKSYQELQSKFGKETSEKAELTRILNEAFATDPVTDTQSDSYVEPDPLAEKVERIERQGAVQNFIFAHPDANAEAMNQVLSSDPIAQQIQGHEAKLEYAYLKSQNMTSGQAIEEARKQASSQTQAKIVEKQSAQVESARRTEKSDENSEIYNRATGNYSQEDRDSARKAWIKKNLINL